MRLLAATLLALSARVAAAAPQVVAVRSLGGPEHALIQPQSVAFDPARRELWVAGLDEKNLGRIVIVDAAAGYPVATVAAGYAAVLAMDPSLGRVYAATYAQVRAFDAATRSVHATYPVTGCNPRAMAVDPASGDLFLHCDFWDNTVLKTRQELVRLSKAGVKLASYLYPSNATYQATGDALRFRAGRVHAALARTDQYNQRRGEAWVFDPATLLPVQTVQLSAGGYPAGSAFDEADGSYFVGDLMGRVWRLRADAAGSWVVVSSPAVGANVWNVAFDPASRKLFLLDYSFNGVHVWDAATEDLVETVEAGKNPVAAAVDAAGGRLWVVNRLSSDLTSITLAQPFETVTVDLRLRGAYDLALDPDGKRAYVTSGLSAGGLQSFDFATGQVGALSRYYYDSPQDVAYFPTLGKLFYYTPGAVRRVTMASGNIWTPTPLFYATGLSAMEGSTRLLATLNRSKTIPYERSMLVVFDAQTESVVREIAIGPSTASARSAAHSFAGGKAYVPLWAAGTVAVVDVENGVLLKTVAVGKSPVAAAVNDGLGKAFVVNSATDSLSVLDTSTDEVVATIPVGRYPVSVAVKRRGARVYVANAADKTLSVVSGVTYETIATLPLDGTPQLVRVDQAADKVYVTLRERGRIVVLEDPHSGDSKAPEIFHTPVAGPVPEDEPIVIRADVTDDGALGWVRLTFWDPGGAVNTVPMKRLSGSLYEGVIPASFVGAGKGSEVAYYLDATDLEGNGPPTGATPGTAASPNRVQLKRVLAEAWHYEFGEVFGGFYRMTPGPSAAVGELRADAPGLEVATGNEEYYPLGVGADLPMGRWFLFDASGKVLFWKDTENDEAHSSVLLYDLEGDGTPEMLGGTTSGNQLQAIGADGGFRWRYILGNHHLGTPAADVVAPGEKPTVFSGAFDTWLRAVDGPTGTLKWAFQAQSWIWSSPTVADLDGDGSKEVAFGSDEGQFYVISASSPTLKWKKVLGGLEDHVRASPAAADLDGDGRREVLIGAPTGVFHCLDGKTGATRWTFATGGEIVSSAAVGDLDGDGKPEIVFGSADGYLYALRSDGSLRWKSAAGSAIYSSPALARRNPGSVLDVYITTLGGLLMVVRGTDGAVLSRFNVGVEVVSSPVAADVDGDGRLEVFFQDRKGDLEATMRGDLFWAVRDLGSSVPPFSREWPMFRSDPAHTGVYGGAAPGAKPEDAAPQQVAGLSVAAPEDGGRLLLAWKPSTEADLAGYRVYRDGQLLVTVETAAHADLGLANGTTYTYQVSAVDLAGHEGPKSDAVSGVPLDRLPPLSKLLVPSAGGFQTGAVVVAGTAADVGSGLAGVSVLVDDAVLERVFTASGTASWSLALASATFTDGTAYELRSRASDLAGNLEQPAPGVSFVFDGSAPIVSLAPPAVQAGTGTALVTLSGTAADATSGIASVSVRVAGPDGGELLAWTAAAGTATWRWEGALKLARGAKYLVQARAMDGAGRAGEAQLEFVHASLAAPAGLALEAPAEGGALKASWKANAEPDVAGYRVYRDDKLLAATTGLSLLDSGLVNGATYAYQVLAVDAAGDEGPRCAAVTGTPLDLLPPVSRITLPADGARLSTTTAGVVGTASDAGTAGVAALYLGLAEGDGAFQWLRAAGAEAFTAAFAGLKDGASYRLTSRAVDRSGNVEASPSSLAFQVDLPPGPVLDLQAALVSTGSARLAWSPPAAPDVAGYRVYKGDGSLAAEIKDASFSIDGLGGGKTYEYLVSAVDLAGQEGPKSAVQVVTPAGGQARAWIRVPTEGKKLWGNAVTIIADVEGPVDRVAFEARHENEGAWTPVSTRDAKPPFSVYWNISDARISTGSYRLRAVAWDVSGFPDQAPAETRVVVDDANADLVEDGNPEVDPNTVHRKEEKLSGAKTEEVALADGTKVVIPPGAVPEGEKLVVAVVPPAEAPKPVAKTAALEPVGVFREFTFTGGTKEFQQDLTVTLPVPDEDNDGIVDGTKIRVEDLRVYYFSESERVWLPVEGAGRLALAVSRGGAGATFKTSHFTLFGLFEEKAAAAAPSLGQTYAFPNPAAKGRNPTFHVDTGEALRMGVRVYDLSGQLVYSAAVEGPPHVIDGRFAYRHTWQAGGAASGVYLYVLDVYGKDGSKSSATSKFALVR